MAEFSSFTITSLKKAGFFIREDVTHGAADTPNLTIAITRIKPLSRLAPVEMSISYGINEAPASPTLIEFYLAAVDAANLPGLGYLRRDSYWELTQSWRNSGTPANTIQLVNREVEDFLNAVPTANTNLATRISAMTLGIITNCPTQDPINLLIQGVLYYVEELIQRVFGSDAVTWDSWEGVQGGLMAEEWEDDGEG